MKKLTYNRTKLGDYTLSTTSMDEEVLTRNHYILADFTDGNGNAYAINTNNNFAYPIIGKRFSQEIKDKYPQFLDERCFENRTLKLTELRFISINNVKKELGLSQNDIAKFFGYKDGGSYARSTRKRHVDNGIIEIYQRTKKAWEEKM